VYQLAASVHLLQPVIPPSGFSEPMQRVPIGPTCPLTEASLPSHNTSICADVTQKEHGHRSTEQVRPTHIH